jgi:hypothetical protein
MNFLVLIFLPPFATFLHHTARGGDAGGDPGSRFKSESPPRKNSETDGEAIRSTRVGSIRMLMARRRSTTRESVRDTTDGDNENEDGVGSITGLGIRRRLSDRLGKWDRSKAEREHHARRNLSIHLEGEETADDVDSLAEFNRTPLGRIPGLHAILTDTAGEPFTLQSFSLFTDEVLMDDSLEFWQEVELFKSGKHPDGYARHVQHILDRYIKVGGEMEVNLSSIDRKSTIDAAGKALGAFEESIAGLPHKAQNEISAHNSDNGDETTEPSTPTEGGEGEQETTTEDLPEAPSAGERGSSKAVFFIPPAPPSPRASPHSPFPSVIPIEDAKKILALVGTSIGSFGGTDYASRYFSGDSSIYELEASAAKDLEVFNTAQAAIYELLLLDAYPRYMRGRHLELLECIASRQARGRAHIRTGGSMASNAGSYTIVDMLVAREKRLLSEQVRSGNDFAHGKTKIKVMSPTGQEIEIIM